MKNKWIKAASVVLTVCILMVVGVGSVYAAEFNDDGNIPANVIIDDDVFITAEKCVIDGTINGLLFAGCQTVTLNGKVNGDAVLFAEYVVVSDTAEIDGNLLFTGADLVVEGKVSGSVFGGSAVLDISKEAVIGRNLYYGGYALQLREGANVATDVFTGVYQAELAGDINRDLTLYAGALELEGVIGRNAKIHLDDSDEGYQQGEWLPYMGGSQYLPPAIPAGVRISEQAKIAGDVNITSYNDLSAQFVKITAGEVIFNKVALQEAREYTYKPRRIQREVMPGLFVSIFVVSAFRSFIVLMVMGALALWLLNKPFKKVVEAAYQKPLNAMGWGFVVLAIFFMALLVIPLAFLMIGLLLAFLSIGGLVFFWFFVAGSALLFAFMAGFFLIFTVAKIVAAYALGRWVLNDLAKVKKENIWLNLLVGVVILIVLRAIPFVGWLISLVATLFGSGAFWLSFVQRKPAAAPTGLPAVVTKK
ncbi:MAG TPA: hypothetical protein G4N92_00190 [Anaerolineae bacterium]|nr:hypothetical protein [Anaerolineae bacterium]